MKFFCLLKENYLIAVLAVFLGILMVLPYFYFQVKLGPDFNGIFPTIIDDESLYLARIKDIVDDHPFLSNAYLFEHKDGLPQQVFLAEWLLAQPVKLFGIDINTAHLIYNFFLPVIAFLLAYFALFLMSKSRLWSIIFSTFLFFGLFWSDFIRPVSPQFNFIFWLTQFIFLWLLIQRSDLKDASRSDLCFLALNILNFGLLFYIYPYYWTYYLIFFGLLAVAYFFTDRKLVSKILITAGGGFVLAIPYFYFNYLSMQLPYYTETLTRLGLIFSYFPSGLRIVSWSAAGLLVFGLFLWKKIIQLDVKTIFFVSGILASVAAVNQHLITGRNLEFSSHYNMAAMFFVVFAAAYLIGNYLEKFPNTTIQRCIVIFGGLAAAVAMFYGLLDYSKKVFTVNENHVYRQNYAAVFDWLNKNTEKDSVVYANSDISRLIPVYTTNNVFYVREANLFFMSDDEVLDRFILNNFSEKFSRGFITENVRSIYGVRYIDVYGHAVQANKLRRLLGLKIEPEIYLPEEVINKVEIRARDLQSQDFRSLIKKYKIDYLVWDKNKNPDWEINSKIFKSVFQSNNLIIFKVIL